MENVDLSWATNTEEADGEEELPDVWDSLSARAHACGLRFKSRLLTKWWRRHDKHNKSPDVSESHWCSARRRDNNPSWAHF